MYVVRRVSGREGVGGMLEKKSCMYISQRAGT